LSCPRSDTLDTSPWRSRLLAALPLILGFLEHVRETRFGVPKITSFVTPPFPGMPEKLGGIVDSVFQKYSNSRLMAKVPKIAPGRRRICHWHARSVSTAAWLTANSFTSKFSKNTGTRWCICVYTIFAAWIQRLFLAGDCPDLAQQNGTVPVGTDVGGVSDADLARQAIVNRPQRGLLQEASEVAVLPPRSPSVRDGWAWAERQVNWWWALMFAKLGWRGCRCWYRIAEITEEGGGHSRTEFTAFRLRLNYVDSASRPPNWLPSPFSSPPCHVPAQPWRRRGCADMSETFGQSDPA